MASRLLRAPASVNRCMLTAAWCGVRAPAPALPVSRSEGGRVIHRRRTQSIRRALRYALPCLPGLSVLAITACAHAEAGVAGNGAGPDAGHGDADARLSAAFDGALIETVGSHAFALGERGDLRPDERGAVRLFTPRVEPAAHNASLDWLTSGPAGRHPLLDGKRRYDIYKSVLTEWLGGSHSPETADVVAVAGRLLADVDPTTTFERVTADLRAHAGELPRFERESLLECLEDLSPWGEGRAVAEAIGNGTLDVFVASALYHGRVRARIETVAPLVERSSLMGDPVFARAYDAATLGLERRRSRQRLVIKHKIQFNTDDPTDETLRETRVPLLPLAAVETSFPDFDADARFRLAIDYASDPAPEPTLEGYLRLDAAVTALTTFERLMFGGATFGPCDADAREATPVGVNGADAWRLRAYLGHYMYALLETIYASYDARFFTEQLEWPTRPEMHEAASERAEARRGALDDALRACAALTPLMVSAGSDPTGPSGRFRMLVDWMTGSFSSAEQAAADSSFFDIRLETTRIWTDRTDGVWLYVEQAATAHRDRPYRQRIYRVVEGGGGFTSEIFTLPAQEAFVGAYREPARFDVLAADSLEEREGCAVSLRWTGEHFEGGTVGGSCTSTVGGASYATSEVELYEDRIETWDRGFDADGQQVWGARSGGYVFRKLRRPSDP